MNGSQTIHKQQNQQRPGARPETRVDSAVPDVRLDDDAVMMLATGKPISYIPLGEEQPIKLSVGMIQKFIARPTKAKQVPSFEDCTNFAMLCRARRLNPFVGDCFMLGYDEYENGKLVGATFSMIVAVQALFKRAEINANFEGMQSGIIVLDADKQIVEREGDLKHPGDSLIGGWAKVYRKDRKIPTYQRLQLDTFNKGTAYWKKDPAGQISKCAEAGALRQAFPSDIGGLYLDMEIESFAESFAGSVHSPGRRALDLSEPTAGTKAGVAKAPGLSRRGEPANSVATPEPDNGPSGGQESSPAAETESEPSKPAGPSGGDPGASGEREDSESASAENSGDTVHKPASESTTTGGRTYEDRDCKLETWQADIAVATALASLESIEASYEQFAPPELHQQIAQLVADRKAQLGKKNGKR